MSKRPTREEVAAARGRTIRDVLGPGIRVLLVGINPSLYSAAVGHHFARPGNRFWKALHAAGFTESVLSPDEDVTLPARGLGLTNLVARATAAADELSSDELRHGARRLESLVRKHQPAYVAFLGIGAYRTAFGRPRAVVGPAAGEDRRRPCVAATEPQRTQREPSAPRADRRLPPPAGRRACPQHHLAMTLPIVDAYGSTEGHVSCAGAGSSRRRPSMGRNVPSISPFLEGLEGR